ncbi:hypothetical protein GCM10009630_25570 [Kribbella jejuensis]|uniref:DUF7144 domain-containing protein n=1 Tax=Kribbella jejuensis TaxID=236068 RepID=A0A542DV42_9ACTN|nr:hypothetical protein [Kribbella jejuensis]TQJ06885.1 hypothetical protein FB475_6561 [Kribbella jejuensis]
MAAKQGGAMTGFVVFAGALLMMTGLVNVFEGFIALFADQRLVITREHLVIVGVTGWGWTILIFGLLLMAVGIGLLTAQTWARITAIVLVCLHAVTQIAWLGAYPVWSLLMIALDTVVLFALTARWSGVRAELAADGMQWSGQEVADLAAAERRRPPLS